MTSSGSKKTVGRSTGTTTISKEARNAFLARLVRLTEPALNGLGLELVSAQCPMEGGRPVLRFFIDHRSQEGHTSIQSAGPVSAVTLDDCAAVSRLLDQILEEDSESQPAEYVLEVSSPGLDRPLVKERDFYRFQGRLVKLRLRRDERSGLHKGRLALNPAGGLALETTEGRLDFTFEDVVSGRLSLDEVVF